MSSYTRKLLQGTFAASFLFLTAALSVYFILPAQDDFPADFDTYTAGLGEDYSDELAREAETEGFCLHPRYSPGYGDFSLDHQQDVIALLGAGKELGITLTEGALMAPGKSVTALIGAEKQDIKGTFYEICT